MSVTRAVDCRAAAPDPLVQPGRGREAVREVGVETFQHRGQALPRPLPHRPVEGAPEEQRGARAEGEAQDERPREAAGRSAPASPGEPVPDADHGLDQVVARLLPERADVDVDGARLHVGGVVPEPGEDRLARDDPPRALHEQPEEVELLLREADLPSVPLHGVPGAVDADPGVLVDVVLRVDAAPAEERGDAREELLHGEGLRDVVVRPEVEPEELVRSSARAVMLLT